jgi:hypothetical protein
MMFVFRDKVKGYTISLQQALNKLMIIEPLKYLNTNQKHK